MDWSDWLGKHIFVRLKTGKVFSGEVIEISDDDGINPVFIKIIDKFNEPVVFQANQVVELKLEGKKWD
jgi:ribosome maturation factor RimP